MNALKNKLNLTVNQTRFWVSNPKAKLRSQFSTGDEAVDMVTFLLQVMAILVHRWHWWNCCCYKTLFWSNFSVNFFAVNLVIRLSCYVAVLLLNKFFCFSLSFNKEMETVFFLGVTISPEGSLCVLSTVTVKRPYNLSFENSYRCGRSHCNNVARDLLRSELETYWRLLI